MRWIIMALICVRTMELLVLNVMWLWPLWPVTSKYSAICCNKKNLKGADVKQSSF